MSSEHNKLNINEAQIDMDVVKRTLMQKNLYEFVKEFWDTYENCELSETWLMEYQAECFMYAARRDLPEWITKEWKTDEEYARIKELTGGSCPIRDYKDRTRHDWRMPPRHSKSTTHNVMGPVWLNTIKAREIASVSHSRDLATDFNVKRQKVLSSAKFKRYFPDVQFFKNSAKEIHLSNGGKLYSASMDGITGYGADYLICDDLVSSEDARKNKQLLSNAVFFYKETAPTRRNQGNDSTIWHIAQRLAPGDVSGSIDEDEALSKLHTKTIIQALPDKDSVVIFPCSGKVKKIAAGEPLWESRFGRYEDLIASMEESGAFETQYNQKPINSSLTIIKKEHIKYITQDEYRAMFLNDYHVELASFDFPVKGKDTNDKTGYVEGVRCYNKLAILGSFEQHMGYKDQKNFCRNLGIERPNMIQIYEDKANGSVLLQDLENEVQGIVAFKPGSNSKEQRLDIAANYLASGNVVFVLDEYGMVPECTKHLIRQLTTFPFCKYDDVVDAFSQLVLYNFTNHDLKVYSKKFDANNVCYNASIYDNVAVDLAIHEFNDSWKVLEIARDYTTDSFIVLEEHLLKGEECDIIERLQALSVGKRMVVESGTDVYHRFMGRIVLEPNYATISDSVDIINQGIALNKIKVAAKCHGTLRDIERFRYTKDSNRKGALKLESLNDGFAGCIRAAVVQDKGAKGAFIT